MHVQQGEELLGGEDFELPGEFLDVGGPLDEDFAAM